MSVAGETSRLLALLQLTDSAFPSGAFIHSHGLEQLVRQGLVQDASDVERFLASVLSGSLATSEAVAARAAAEAANACDMAALLALDAVLHAMKPAAELRAASLQTGRRLLEEVAVHVDSPLLQRYQARAAADPCLGNYAVVFGLTAAVQGIETQDIPAALLLGAATALLQAAMRLTRVSHRDVQATLHRLRPLIAGLAEETAADPPPATLTGFHPLQDIAAMRHAEAEARLFAS